MSNINSTIPKEVQEKEAQEKETRRSSIIKDVIEKADKRNPIIEAYTSKGKMTISKMTRSCFNCKFSTICYAFKELKEIIKYLPSNIDGNDAPMKQRDVFKALAGCCLVYEENN